MTLLGRAVTPFLAPIAALAFGACASPVNGSRDPIGTNKGPGADLAGFITPVPDDMSVAPLVDMAKVTSGPDLAQPLVDLATSPDLKMASGGACGGIDYNGICQGNVLKYCLQNKLEIIDCAASGYQCLVVLGSADCY